MVARQAAQRLRNKMSLEWTREAGLRIQQTVLDLPEMKAARGVGLYLATPREVATDLIVESVRSRGQLLALPAWRKDSGSYGMARWDKDAPLAQGHYGIPEPVDPAWVSMAELDVMIVTCLAFDPNGWRLGHGGGHFDRLLAAHSGAKICLAFEGQKLVAVPCEEHDIPVHLVVTERAIYRAPAGLTYADPEAWKR